MYPNLKRLGLTFLKKKVEKEDVSLSFSIYIQNVVVHLDGRIRVMNLKCIITNPLNLFGLGQLVQSHSSQCELSFKYL